MIFFVQKNVQSGGGGGGGEGNLEKSSGLLMAPQFFLKNISDFLFYSFLLIFFSFFDAYDAMEEFTK